MKHYFIILFIALAGCATKTHFSSTELSSNLKFNSDTSGRKALLIVDKTKTFTTKTIDTVITISGSILSGYLSAPILNIDTSARFENEDLSVIVNIDKFGLTRFVAAKKSKKTPVKIHEYTEIHKDVSTKQNADIKVRTSVEAINKLEQKHSEKQTNTKVNLWLNIALLATTAVALIWVVRKLNLLKILTN